MRNLIKLLLVIFFFSLFSKCAKPFIHKSGQYSYDSRGRYLTGVLSDTDYLALKAYLQQSSLSELKDTIIIKYDFNSNGCWHLLDDHGDSTVLKQINQYQEAITKEALKRPGISIFEYRERGNKISNYRKWNQSVKIDSGFLQQLFFTEKTVCGTSVIILPGHQFLLVKTDPHFDALFILSKRKILTALFPEKH